MAQKVMSMGAIEERRWKMSKEYIEREAALKITNDLKDDDNSRFYNVALSDVRTELMALTTADVKPV